MMKISDTFQKAKQLLIEQGWQTGQMKDSWGHLCLMGAIGKAENIDNLESLYHRDLWPESMNFARAILEKREPSLQNLDTAIDRWNDAYADGINDVLNFLDEATIAAKEQGL